MLVLHEKRKQQVAVCSFIPACPLPGPGAPPFGPGLPRRPDWRGALITTAVRGAGKLSSRVSRRAINAVRAQSGLPPIATSPAEHTGTMPLYLVPATRGFDYDRRDLPTSVHYVGPYLWNRPRTEAATPWLADLPRGVPVVHVSEGTVHVQKRFVLEAALTGLVGLPLQVVATTGGGTPGDLGVPVPPNALVVPWVSHADLLPKTAVMVTTGGAGSVLASLAAGVPLVIVPTEWDKPEIAQRVVEAGAGVRLLPRLCTAERLRACVLDVLGNPSYKARATAIAREFEALGREVRAAELLEALSEEPFRNPRR
jgi:MGT family glycosyltransferase